MTHFRLGCQIKLKMSADKSFFGHFRSELLRIIETFVFLPGLLTGHSAEKQVSKIILRFIYFFKSCIFSSFHLDCLFQTCSSILQGVEIQFFDDFFDDPLSPAIQLDVQIKSRFVEIYSAVFRIHANFSGLRFLFCFLGSLVDLRSISSTFYARNFCRKVCSKPNSKPVFFNLLRIRVPLRAKKNLAEPQHGKKLLS